jgi:hypothetical protein
MIEKKGFDNSKGSSMRASAFIFKSPRNSRIEEIFTHEGEEGA